MKLNHSSGLYEVTDGPVGLSSRSPRRASEKSPLKPQSVSVNVPDRFIPNRCNLNTEMASYLLSESHKACRDAEVPTRGPTGRDAASQYSYQDALLKATFDTPYAYSQTPAYIEKYGDKQMALHLAGLIDPSAPTLNPVNDQIRVLSYNKAPPVRNNCFNDKWSVLYATNRLDSATSTSPTRRLDGQAYKILDAPEFVDDYYLNTLDWSCLNIMAIALNTTVYLWNATTSEITELYTLNDPHNYITSLSWIEDGIHLAIGTAFKEIEVWDCKEKKRYCIFLGHTARVSSLAWNGVVLSSAGRDTSILNHDARIKGACVSAFLGHSQEVCGLKWSPDGSQLASGGNDNLVNVWTPTKYNKPLHCFTQHQAATKAIAWCPWQASLLASGGGTADRTIKLWNTNTGAHLNSTDTGSQVSSIIWSKISKELVSAHGFSKNQLCVWKYPLMDKIGDLNGHSSRVLQMAMSPDGTTVASVAGDETLRFWAVFDKKKVNAGYQRGRRTTSGLTLNLIR